MGNKLIAGMVVASSLLAGCIPQGAPMAPNQQKPPGNAVVPAAPVAAAAMHVTVGQRFVYKWTFTPADGGKAHTILWAYAVKKVAGDDVTLVQTRDGGDPQEISRNLSSKVFIQAGVASGLPEFMAPVGAETLSVGGVTYQTAKYTMTTDGNSTTTWLAGNLVVKEECQDASGTTTVELQPT